MDALDHRIVHLLQKDGKMKIKEIADQLKLTNTPVFERIKKLESQGVIKSYRADVDLHKIGYAVTAFCTVSLERHHTEIILQFVEDIKKLDEVSECYHIAGMFDYLLKIHVCDMDAYHHFISEKLASLPNIGRVQSSFVMSEIKNDPVLPVLL